MAPSTKPIIGVLIALIIFAVGIGIFNMTPASSSPVEIRPSSDPSIPAKQYSLTDIAAHNSKESCWTAVDNKVYDLTSFISLHPGGADNIMSICGIDGSAAFAAQHGGQRRPENELAGLSIGELTP